MTAMATTSEALLQVRDLKKHYPIRNRLFGPSDVLRAVDGVSFDVAAGETLGLVGESGCGKSTVGRAVVGLVKPSAGSVRLAGMEIAHFSKRRLRPLRTIAQIVFQDPYSSLNPRMRARTIVGEPLRNFGRATGVELDREVARLFERVGLRREALDFYPHEFSGGQRQRLGIARAIALSPQLIVCDEPVSALDVSIQAQILNLLRDLQADAGLAFLFISHDLAVVRHVSHRVAVMYVGRLVETAPRAELFEKPFHPYTHALLAAVPDPDPRVKREFSAPRGEVPSPITPPSGCHFHPRCPHAEPRCALEIPRLRQVAPGRHAACHLL